MSQARFFLLGYFLVVSMIGCSGSTTGPNENTNERVGNASDCSTTSSDVLMELDEDESTDLAASAVTSDCDEIAIYGDDKVSQAAFSTSDGDEVLAEFDEDGNLVAIRNNEDALSVTYNESMGYARAEFTPEDGDTSSSVFSVDRDDSTSARRRAFQDEMGTAEFCDELEQMVRTLTSACEADPDQVFCDGPIRRASQAASDFCNAQEVDTYERLEGKKFDAQRRDFPLGVNGFATARPAAGGGTTFILSAEVFGGTAPYSSEWSLLEWPADASATLTHMPGNAAVVDADVNRGTYGFRITATDENGTEASDDVRFNLGDDDDFVGAVIVATNEEPDVGQMITLKLTSDQFASDDTNTAQEDGSEDSLRGKIYWNFGDGHHANGRQVSHAYEQDGVYLVTVFGVIGENDVSDSLEITVGTVEGLTDDERSKTFTAAITTEKDSMEPGQTNLLTASSQNAVGNVSYRWGIVNPEGEFVAELQLAASTADADEITYGNPVELYAIEPGIVQVGVMALDEATGRIAIDTQSVPVFDEDGGLFAAIEGPHELRAGIATPMQSLVIGGEGTLTYEWYIEDDPYGQTDDSASISNRSSVAPEITATLPGFLGVGLNVRDEAGNEASTFIGIAVYAEGYNEIFVEYLGPFDVPLGVEVPLHVLIAGGKEPYYCAWNIADDTDGSGGSISDPFECHDAFYVTDEEGCATIELKVKGSGGQVGRTSVAVCAGDFELYEDPCPLDGVCDELCPYLDPDCIEGEFCVPDDGLCDEFCEREFGERDSDCDSCELDGICVFNCPNGDDPDCDRDYCVAGDGRCDPGCQPRPDPDCDELSCQPNDGICDFDCPTPDPDCGQTNEEICRNRGFCCVGDDFCDIDECPEPDADCDHCVEDGVCVYACQRPDPDCDNQRGGCLDDSDCEDGDPCTLDYCETDDFGSYCFFEYDPECFDRPIECTSDADCDDFDECTEDFCDFETGQCDFTYLENCQPIDDVCGDSICGPTESATDCPIDCDQDQPFCGDGFCDDTESETSCPSDCRLDQPFCGDGVCDDSETAADCPADCAGQTFCGDSICDPDETVADCPEDCGTQAFCGDGICDFDETAANCPTDCALTNICGDGICDPGESVALCPIDCDTTSFCGDGTCDVSLGEDRVTCPEDCPLE